jgi:hypothetical protein
MMETNNITLIMLCSKTPAVDVYTQVLLPPLSVLQQKMMEISRILILTRCHQTPQSRGQLLA